MQGIYSLVSLLFVAISSYFPRFRGDSGASKSCNVSQTLPAASQRRKVAKATVHAPSKWM